ncbi:MAG: flavin reductase (DIM6/NTAB) family NADH-FMN oxidoreductase RutF [Verrucomicrobiales bacterium]|jgi:flavin reductase (DIM6/NTAB) family NADH-FMN oxidoreductase RutF
MEFDLTGEHKDDAYILLAGLVTPRPIAWVTTQDEDGRVNAAPFSFFNVFGSKPPIIAFAPGDKEPGIPKDTARNIRKTGEFVVNLVDEANAKAMNLTATELPLGESELELAGLTAAPSSRVTPPRIAEAPVSLECREWSTLEIGQNRLVIGLVDWIYVREGVIDPETLLVNREAFQPIGRMEVPAGYTRTTDRFDMPRP